MIFLYSFFHKFCSGKSDKENYLSNNIIQNSKYE
jgi:hypothetical protein